MQYNTINGKDSAWTPRYAELTRTKVLHCKMELTGLLVSIRVRPTRPANRENREISGSLPGSHNPSIFPSRENCCLQYVRELHRQKAAGGTLHGSSQQASVKFEACGYRFLNLFQLEESYYVWNRRLCRSEGCDPDHY